MNLPDLPKRRKHKEADFGLKFREWIEEALPPSAAYEHKTTAGKPTLAFGELSEMQIHRGLQISGKKGCLIRIQLGTTGAPDYIWLKEVPYYVTIEYPQGFVMISINAFYNEKRSSKTRSLTWERAIEISHEYVRK